ncbi:polyketide synthase dehydratase domain-containing protein, partial [Planomonospora algeriensis]
DAVRFGVHPALLDAALHAQLVEGDGQTVLPFSWAGVRLHSAGTSAVRVRISQVRDNAIALEIADLSGAPVLSVDSLAVRPISADQFTAGHRPDSLHRLEWGVVEAGSAEAPGWVLVESLADAVDAVDAVDVVGAAGGCVLVEVAGVRGALGLVQEWLAGERSGSS